MKKPLDLHLDPSSVFTSLFLFFTWTKGILDWESLEAQMDINANQFILLFYMALWLFIGFLECYASVIDEC